MPMYRPWMPPWLSFRPSVGSLASCESGKRSAVAGAPPPHTKRTNERIRFHHQQPHSDSDDQMSRIGSSCEPGLAPSQVFRSRWTSVSLSTASSMRRANSRMSVCTTCPFLAPGGGIGLSPTSMMLPARGLMQCSEYRFSFPRASCGRPMSPDALRNGAPCSGPMSPWSPLLGLARCGVMCRSRPG